MVLNQEVVLQYCVLAGSNIAVAPYRIGTVIVQPLHHSAQPTSNPQRNMFLQKSYWFVPTLQATGIPGQEEKFFTEQSSKTLARKI
jgi:hypothetical protein